MKIVGKCRKCWKQVFFLLCEKNLLMKIRIASGDVIHNNSMFGSFFKYFDSVLPHFFYCLPNDKNLLFDQTDSKLKAFTDDRINCVNMTFSFFNRVENIVRKRENAAFSCISTIISEDFFSKLRIAKPYSSELENRGLMV